MQRNTKELANSHHCAKKQACKQAQPQCYTEQFSSRKLGSDKRTGTDTHG